MTIPEHPFEYYEWLDFVNKKIVHIKSDDDALSSIKDAMSDANDGSEMTFGVTEIVNPMQAYYRRMYPQMPEDPEVIQKLEYGTSVHNLALYWLRHIHGDVVREIDIDGSKNGLDGIRGRIDFTIADSIIEFKTTRHIINTEDDVIDQNPHDIEQLCTYAIATSVSDNIHFLVYFSEDLEGMFRVFSIKITDKDAFSSAILKRKSDLENALKTENPESLGKCRYLDTGCKFNLSGICECNKEEKISDSHLRNFLMIVRDREFENKLQNAKANVIPPQIARLSMWDLFTPRKAYLRKIGEFVQKMPESEKSRGLSLHDIESAIRHSPSYAGNKEMMINGTSLGYSWGIRPSIVEKEAGVSKESNGYTPVITRISNKIPQDVGIGTISPHYLARLGLVCAATGSRDGYVAMGFKNNEADMKFYRVEFDDLESMRNEIERRVAEVTEAFENDDISGLPKCPDFVRKSCGSNCLCTDK